MTKKSTTVATVAIYFAVMLIIQVITTALFQVWPFPIRPTLLQIPVVIASILYRPKIGATLGGLMGVISVTTATIIQTPASYLFSPFVENGQMSSLLIAILPRILIGITPYFVYKLIKNKFGLALAGILGSLTNTIFVLSGIFIFFSSVYNGNIQALLAVVISTNSIAEMLICGIIVYITIPRLEKLKH